MKKQGKDLKLRLLSIFIAIILWIYVVNAQNSQNNIKFNIVPSKIEKVK